MNPVRNGPPGIGERNSQHGVTCPIEVTVRQVGVQRRFYRVLLETDAARTTGSSLPPHPATATTVPQWHSANTLNIFHFFNPNFKIIYRTGPRSENDLRRNKTNISRFKDSFVRLLNKLPTTGTSPNRNFIFLI